MLTNSFRRVTALNRYCIPIVLALAAVFQSGMAGSDEDPLTGMGYRATQGAAAGYVDDRACGVCHADKYQSYQHVGMAKSFARPSEAAVIEDFGKEFYHEPTQRYYQIRRQGEDWIFRRYQRDDAGAPINDFQTKIDWIMGSGNRARSYFFQTEWGELYMLPLGWYSENQQWGMSPGFEYEGHPGLTRRVNRQCMFCHNAFAEVPSGSDVHWQVHRFPKDLPRGTGCQRCHGPGAEHIRAALQGAKLETIHGHIVNPRKLSPERRDSVCFQCHMLPAVAITGARRFDRDDYSFRPGQRLSEYLVHVEVEAGDIEKADFFEINHHGYRFWQSRCFQESKGKLACISCHDPHVKPASKAFRAKVAGVCVGCHENQKARHPPNLAGEDCVTCHMPTRRTRDVVLVTMTDHRIARGPFDHKKLIAPMTKTQQTLVGLNLLPWDQNLTGDEAETYRIVSTLRQQGEASAVRALQGIFSRREYRSPVPYLDLLRAQIQIRAFSDAERTAKWILHRQPDLFPAQSWLGVAQLWQDKSGQALESFKKSISIQPTPEGHYNLAVVAYQREEYDLALDNLERAISMRSNLPAAWWYKGRVQLKFKRYREAKDAMQRSLELDPENAKAYADLIRLLRLMGEHQEADRYLKVGLRVALKPGVLRQLETQPSPGAESGKELPR